MANVRPKKCCYPVCDNCPYSDCRNDAVEYSDIIRQDVFDKEVELENLEPHILRRRNAVNKYLKTEQGKKTLERYRNSDKGKASSKRYEASDKGKERAKRYDKSKKGKERAKRTQQKRISNGKNAEACRRYYERKKLRLLQQA